MRWLPAAVVSGVFAWLAWTNQPLAWFPSRAVWVLSVVGCVWLAWWAGRRSGRAAAFAAAMARAEARATAVAASEARSAAQAAVVVNVGQGAREVAAAELGGLDQVEWRGERRELALEQDVAGSLADELATGADAVRELEVS